MGFKSFTRISFSLTFCIIASSHPIKNFDTVVGSVLLDELIQDGANRAGKGACPRACVHACVCVWTKGSHPTTNTETSDTDSRAEDMDKDEVTRTRTWTETDTYRLTTHTQRQTNKPTMRLGLVGVPRSDAPTQCLTFVFVT